MRLATISGVAVSLLSPEVLSLRFSSFSKVRCYWRKHYMVVNVSHSDTFSDISLIIRQEKCQRLIKLSAVLTYAEQLGAQCLWASDILPCVETALLLLCLIRFLELLDMPRLINAVIMFFSVKGIICGDRASFTINYYRQLHSTHSY